MINNPENNADPNAVRSYFWFFRKANRESPVTAAAVCKAARRTASALYREVIRPVGGKEGGREGGREGRREESRVCE